MLKLYIYRIQYMYIFKRLVLSYRQNKIKGDIHMNNEHIKFVQNK